MKLINTRLISSLKPCESRFNNFLSHYKDFSGTIEDFVDLENITHSDKLWVVLRLLPRVEVEVFAIECIFKASTTKAATAYYAAKYAEEEELQRQLDVLVYLWNNLDEGVL